MNEIEIGPGLCTMYHAVKITRERRRERLSLPLDPGAGAVIRASMTSATERRDGGRPTCEKRQNFTLPDQEGRERARKLDDTHDVEREREILFSPVHAIIIVPGIMKHTLADRHTAAFLQPGIRRRERLREQ